MQICGNFSVDLKAKYRLPMKDLRRLVLLCSMRPGCPNLHVYRIGHSDLTASKAAPAVLRLMKIRRREPAGRLNQSPASAVVQLKS
jgi:hypothetical protein